jgi:hypothetical protein
MTKVEAEILMHKAEKEDLSPEERLALLKYANSLVGALKQDIDNLNNN